MLKKKSLSIKLRDFVSELASKFLHKIRCEVWETREAGIIASKYIKNKEVTEFEKKFMLVQIFDVCKIILIGIPFAIIPGASILLPFIIKCAYKMGVNLLPSNFSK
jgi:hypothetical protein